VTGYGYDGLDQLSSVTDPRNNATSYTLDGLGNLTAQSSPDTGPSANTHDAAGNLIAASAAKGQSTSYTYDPLNRVTRIVFNQATGTQLKQLDYTYDQGANGVGRLSSITETSAAGAVLQTTTYVYDPHGRIVSETRGIGGHGLLPRTHR
jgi:YD repeat-containing protein